MSRLLKFLVAALLLLAGPARAAETPVPPSPSPHYVYDAAGWLTPSAFTQLDQQLESYERETSSQFLVAIFPKIPDGEEMFDFSQKVFEAWKPGIADRDNGAILFIYAADRKLRIHTGRGVEGVLPDARCNQIINNDIVPLLKKGDKEAAVTAGVNAMIAASKGEYKGTGKTNLDDAETEDTDSQLVITLVVIIVIILLSLRKKNRNDGFGGGSFGSGSFGGGGFGGGSGSSSGGGGFSGGGGDSGGGGSSGEW